MHIQSEENSVTEAKSKVDEAQPVIIESKEEIKKEDKEEVKENIKEDVEIMSLYKMKKHFLKS